MKDLVDDQIHNGPFIQACTHIWSDDVSRDQKSGVYDYYKEISERFNKTLVDHTNMPKEGLIYVGMCHLLEQVFGSIPRRPDDKYIFIHRTNDRPFTKEMYSCKPPSVKHIYTVDCQVNTHDVSAIPFGNASINGEDEIVKMVAKEKVEPAKTKLFVRMNVNNDGSTQHRMRALSELPSKSFAKIITHQIPQDEFFRECKAHKFTLALAGCGADASRQWSAIQLGSIPIVTDCIEMRHFKDLPLVYCPLNMSDLTEEWLDKQSVEGKSTERMRASYWINHINNKKKEHGIS